MIPDNPRLGVIGFGEVGYHIAKGLKQAGISQIIAYDNASRTKPALTQAFQQKAESIGIKLATTPKELANGSDLILSTVIPKASVAATTEAAPFLTPAQLYVDLNSCSPETKKEGEAILKERGVRYVDGAILGAPLQLEHQAQIFACGEGAEEFRDTMSCFAMKIRVISGNVGDAALLKMIYSVTTKGISALLWESFLALHKAGLEPNVYEGLDNWLTQMGLFDRADTIIGRSAIHAARRAGEMEFSADTMRTLGIEPMMAEATKNRLTWCADFNFKDYFPEGWPSGYKAVFEVMDRITQESKPQT
ncbi:NAD(P)-binding domain-containing protein [Chloroflexota bacterium]